MKQVTVKEKAEAAPALSGQHTPGPWHITRTARGHVRMIRCERTLPGAIEGLAVAKIVHAVGFDEEHANARLIASAPDLLQALKASVKSAEHYGADPYQEPWLIDARAAIAKAEGRAS